jgi:DNA adenine methylase
MKPFLKWAGSKYKIMNRILETLPKGQRLIEPFAGSGAVFLSSDFDEYLIADTNADLINLFKQIQSHGDEFIRYGATFFTPENNTELAFYTLRSEFNECVDPVKRSALFIYLNRHCFNGLCRYNSKGKFNVPFGRYVKPTFPAEAICNFHEKSKRAIFEVADFKATMDKAEDGCVVYCDPPYAPLTTTANFTAYTQNRFGLEEQHDLAAYAKKLTEQGIPVIISNHNTEFTRAIYSEAKLTSFDVQRFISSDFSNRNKAAELIAVYG